MLEDDSTAAPLLDDLRRALPADATMQNLLGIMSTKLDLCGRLPIYEYEANIEGHRTSAAAFHELAQVERESFNALVTCLRRHLDETGNSDRAAASKPKRPARGRR